MLLLLATINAAAQKPKPQRIPEDMISVRGSYAVWCKDAEDECIEKLRVSFYNHGEYNVTSVTFQVIMVNNATGRVIYNQKHTVEVNIPSASQGSTPAFKLKKNVKVKDVDWSANVAMISAKGIEESYEE